MRQSITDRTQLPDPCPMCKGTGNVYGIFATYEGIPVTKAVCPRCNGAGEVVR